MRRRTIVALLIAAGVVGGVGVAGGTLKLSENPAFCNSLCHIMNPYYESHTSAALDRLAYRHARKGVTCKDCHHADPSQQIQKVIVYIKGEAQTPLAMRLVDNEYCYGCKEHATYAQILEQTAEAQPNPHNPKLETIKCRLCHRMHRP